MAGADNTRIREFDFAALVKAIPRHLHDDFCLMCKRLFSGEINSDSLRFVLRRMKSGKLSQEALIRFMAGRVG